MAGPKFRMPDAILERLRKEVFPYVEGVDLRGSGESTLDPRLLPLARELTEEEIRVQLYTNMTTRGPEFWRELGRLPLHVAVSVDAATPQLLERIRRGLRMRKFLENLDALQQGRSAAGTKSDLYFSAVIGDENFHEIPGLVQLAAKYGVRTVRLNPLTVAQTPRAYPRIGVSSQKVGSLRKAMTDGEELGRRMGVTLELAATLDCSGGGVNEPVVVLAALERRFLDTGHPRNLALYQINGVGDRQGGGTDRFVGQKYR